jgi:hypothetical protein
MIKDSACLPSSYFIAPIAFVASAAIRCYPLLLDVFALAAVSRMRSQLHLLMPLS